MMRNFEFSLSCVPVIMSFIRLYTGIRLVE